MIQKIICENIKKARERKGFTQREMAVRLHVDERNYRRIENGESKYIDLKLLIHIAAILNIDLLKLLKGVSFRD